MNWNKNAFEPERHCCLAIFGFLAHEILCYWDIFPTVLWPNNFIMVSDNLFNASTQWSQAKYNKLSTMPTSQISTPQVLATSQNFTLLLERDICFGIIPTENVSSSRITRECVEIALDSSEKKASHGLLQNAGQNEYPRETIWTRIWHAFQPDLRGRTLDIVSHRHPKIVYTGPLQRTI